MLTKEELKNIRVLICLAPMTGKEATVVASLIAKIDMLLSEGESKEDNTVEV
jgi:hypothetical protein